MKKILLTLTLTISLTSLLSQTKISYISPKKDTLMLPNNELGKLIRTTWKSSDTIKTKTPVIILTDEKIIKRKNELAYDNRKRKPFKN